MVPFLMTRTKDMDLSWYLERIWQIDYQSNTVILCSKEGKLNSRNQFHRRVDLEEDLAVPAVEDEAVVVDHAVVVLDGEIKEDMELHHGIKEDTVENGIKDMVVDMGDMMMDMEVDMVEDTHKVDMVLVVDVVVVELGVAEDLPVGLHEEDHAERPEVEHPEAELEAVEVPVAEEEEEDIENIDNRRIFKPLTSLLTQKDVKKDEGNYMIHTETNGLVT